MCERPCGCCRRSASTSPCVRCDTVQPGGPATAVRLTHTSKGRPLDYTGMGHRSPSKFLTFCSQIPGILGVLSPFDACTMCREALPLASPVPQCRRATPVVRFPGGHVPQDIMCRDVAYPSQRSQGSQGGTNLDPVVVLPARRRTTLSVPLPPPLGAPCAPGREAPRGWCRYRHGALAQQAMPRARAGATGWLTKAAGARQVAPQGTGCAPGAPCLDGGRRPLPAVRTHATTGSGADAGGRQVQGVVRLRCAEYVGA
jgi:hypothetical protein